MTTTVRKRVRCAVCRTESDRSVVAGTMSFGRPDLDTRPAPLARHTLDTRVHRCPRCGYCAADIGEEQPGAAELVRSPAYREQLEDEAYPELAREFLCQAMLGEQAGRLAAAALSRVRAVWACDDAGFEEAAATCRRNAARMLQRAEQAGQSVSRQEGAGSVLLVDLLRRSGQLDAALAVALERKDAVPPGTVRRLLLYQELLIRRGDTGCHTVDEALADG